MGKGCPRKSVKWNENENRDKYQHFLQTHWNNPSIREILCSLLQANKQERRELWMILLTTATKLYISVPDIKI